MFHKHLMKKMLSDNVSICHHLTSLLTIVIGSVVRINHIRFFFFFFFLIYIYIYIHFIWQLASIGYFISYSWYWLISFLLFCLCVKKTVIQTKSVEYMPFSLSLCVFLNACVWGIYSMLIKDIFVGVTFLDLLWYKNVQYKSANSSSSNLILI